MDDKAKLEKLKDAVLEQAKEKSDDIAKQDDIKKEEVLEKAEDNILEEAYKMIQHEVSEIRGEIGRELSVRSMESRKEVLLEREHYIDTVFSEVKKKLLAFTKTEAYIQYMNKSIDTAKETLGEITRIYVARPDVEAVKKLAGNVEVRQDLRILIGGIIAESDGLIADYTFDKKLKTEREKFNSMISVV